MSDNVSDTGKIPSEPTGSSQSDGRRLPRESHDHMVKQHKHFTV
jgi:hypothetical protein